MDRSQDGSPLTSASTRPSYCGSRAAREGSPGGSMCNPCVNPWRRSPGALLDAAPPDDVCRRIRPCSRNAASRRCSRPRSSSPPVRPGRRRRARQPPARPPAWQPRARLPPRPRARPPAQERARAGTSFAACGSETAGTAVKIGGVTDVGRLDDKSFNEAGWCGTLKGGTVGQGLVQGHRDQGQEGLPNQHEAPHGRGRDDHRHVWLRTRHGHGDRRQGEPGPSASSASTSSSA